VLGASLASLESEYEGRCQRSDKLPASLRQTTRDSVLREAGGLDYDRIEHEFAGISQSLDWPRAATLKDLRHLFSTCLENAGVPELYRKFLMGHSLGRAPIVGYTHLNAIRQQYQRALDTELAPFVQVIEQRASELGQADVLLPICAEPSNDQRPRS
jgi:hypothetical protein